jgi:uncharacterized membrane protein
MVLYPLLPWIGVLVMGYCAGKLFEPARSSQSRRKILVWLGSSLVLLFLVLRILNGYGDPNPWSSGQSLLSSFYSFMNVTKYPPSLMYLCATLGPGLIFLGLAETMKGRVAAFFTVFGRVPFFYYVLHFYLIHLITLIAFFLSGFGWQDIHDPQSPFLFRPHQFGFSLAFVYLEWIAVVFALYPLCRWFGRYKRTHTQWWLTYL